MKALWPYILPLPVNRGEFNRVLQTVFCSKAAPEILKRAAANKRIYQKELISELGFSNKTVIKTLKKLVSTGILDQGMERRSEKGKTIWVKWYTPTFQGKWLTLLLQAPESIPKEEAKRVVQELFMMYMENIVRICSDYEIDPGIFESAMNKALLKMIRGTTQTTSHKSRVIVCGSAAKDTMVMVDKLPKADETLYLPNVQEFSGGSGANVAIALARLGIPVSFLGRVGGDAEGVELMKAFRKDGVDTSGAVVDLAQRTVKTFITINKGGGKSIYVLGGDNVALSLSSPNEINWKKIQESDIVYIGEVFVEIAELVASFARSCKKRVIYRPGLIIVTTHPERFRNALRNVDVLIINSHAWKAIEKSSGSILADPLEMGPKIVIVTNGMKGCEIFTKDENFVIPAYPVEAVDTTGAGDAFAAGLICALLEGQNLKYAVKYALAVSTINVTKVGARTALPTKSEVETFMKREKIDEHIIDA